MSRDDVMENIGTIAKSGTRAFLDQLSGDEQADAHLIGQFGVGFYSSFIVADRVTVLTRKAGDEAASEGVRWESDGAGEYSSRPVERETHGTEVVLHLKESAKEFLEHLDPAFADQPLFRPHWLSHPHAARRTRTRSGEWQDVNKASALWTLPKSDISDEEYQSFYKYLTHDLDDALCWAHNKVEGSQSYTTLLYVPGTAPMDLMLQRDERSGLRLYVKRVFIMDAAQQLLPHYLRFVRGVVDSDDLPLNVSRELLQENELSGKIRSAVIRRSLDLIAKGREGRPREIRVLLERVRRRASRKASSRTSATATASHRCCASRPPGAKATGRHVDLAAYVERMPEGQEAIYYITAENYRAAAPQPAPRGVPQEGHRGVADVGPGRRVDDGLLPRIRRQAVQVGGQGRHRPGRAGRSRRDGSGESEAGEPEATLDADSAGKGEAGAG